MLGDIFDCRCIEICMFVVVFSILVLQLEVWKFTQRGDFNALSKCVDIQLVLADSLLQYYTQNTFESQLNEVGFLGFGIRAEITNVLMVVVMYRCAPVSTSNTFQNLPRLRETADNTEPSI
jgi:hypothetical protein